MSDFSDYKQRRDKISQLLSKASQTFQEFDPNEAESLKDLSQSTANGKFSIIVAGQFSAGKSTFLNALMGNKYLPSFTKETTATINELKSVSESPTGKPAVTVNYKNGKTVTLDDVSLENISKYVCTDGDDVVNTIKSVELYLDSPFLNNGVRLIDTPGLNGIAEGHTDVTRREFGQCHAAIFMFCSAAAGTETDYKILKEMKSYGNSILFVLNQIDLIKKEENETPESVIQNLRAGFSKQFPGETLPEIWPVSSYQALVGRNKTPLTFHERIYDTQETRNEILSKSRFEDFEGRLMRYLTQGERAKAELLSPIKQLEAKISKQRESVQIRISVLNSDINIEEFKEKKAALENEISLVQKENQKSSSAIKKMVFELISDTEDALKTDSREIKKKYLGKLEKSEYELDEFESNSRTFLRSMEREYKDSIESHLDSLDAKVKRIISEKFEDYQSIISEHQYKKNKSKDIEVASVKLDTSLFEIDLDFQSYEDKLDEMYEKQFELSIQAGEEEYKAEMARKNVENIKSTEAESKTARDYYNDKIEALGFRPGAEERVRTVVKKKGGLGGFFKWIGTGTREYNDTEPYLDTSRQEAYDRQLQDLRLQQQNELSEFRDKLDQLRTLDTNVSLHDYNSKRSEAERQSIERKIERLQREREQKITKELRKRTLAAKDYVEGCLIALDKQCMKAAIEELNNQEGNITSFITKVIDDVLSLACAEKKAELDSIVQKLESGAEEIAKEVKTLTQRDEALQSILFEAVDLRREIEDLETDVIEQM